MAPISISLALAFSLTALPQSASFAPFEEWLIPQAPTTPKIALSGARTRGGWSTYLAEEELAFAEAMAQKMSSLGSVSYWPGYRLADIPIIFHQPGIAWLFNWSGELPETFQPIPALPGVAVSRAATRYPKGYDIGRKIGDKVGVSVSVDSLEGRARDEAFFTALHEAFHLTQFGWEEIGDLDTEDRKLSSDWDLALAEVEQRLLADALRSSGAAEQDAIKRFLAVRHERHDYLPLEERSKEIGLETIEGTAYLVESIARAGGDRNAAEAKIVGRLREALSSDSLMRPRFYRTGAALALLLDRRLGGWHSKAEAGRPLTDLLAGAHGYSDGERRALLTEVNKRYPLAAAEARKAGTSRKQKQAAKDAMDTFKTLKGNEVLVRISRRPDRAGGLSLDGSQAFSLNDKESLLVDGTVSVEDSGISVLVEGPVIYARERDRRFTFKTELAPGSISINGKPWLPSAGLQSGRLDLETERATIRADQAVVRVRGSRIEIDV